MCRPFSLSAYHLSERLIESSLDLRLISIRESSFVTPPRRRPAAGGRPLHIARWSAAPSIDERAGLSPPPTIYPAGSAAAAPEVAPVGGGRLSAANEPPREVIDGLPIAARCGLQRYAARRARVAPGGTPTVQGPDGRMDTAQGRNGPSVTCEGSGHGSERIGSILCARLVRNWVHSISTKH